LHQWRGSATRSSWSAVFFCSCHIENANVDFQQQNLYSISELPLALPTFAQNLTPLAHIIRLSNADIFQQDGTKVLQNISLNLGEGEFSYLIGKTGSGKSSLLKTLYAALPLENGVGEVAGFDLGTISRKNIHLLRRKLGIVFQDFNLLTDRNVEENLRFVLQATGWTDAAEMQKRIAQVLEEVGLSVKRNAMPFELSGGEQQRIVIARALLNHPVLLLADEPTGNLDPETSDDVLTLMRNLAKQHNTAVLCATHDYRILKNFPARIIRVQSGKLIDDEGVGIR
jgi:cell division transport system ATP-binding protein